MGSLTNGGVDTYPADEHDLETYRQAQAAIGQMQWPVLVHADNPHERLYVAALDGTGNNMHKDAPENWSVVAKVHKQVEVANLDGDTAIATGYVPGIGTQDGFFARTRDGITGYTFEQRVETAYFDFCKMAKKWIDEDSNAQIRVAGIGFSRGAEEVAALHRMIDERGIRDPVGAIDQRNHEGLITQIHYADKPLLREPGQTVQVALLYDPVATGLKDIDRRLRSSVVAGLQLTAEDERRDQFRSTTHIAPGCSDDGRFCNLTVGGAHSDVGNTYSRNGLGVLSFNLGVDPLNALSDRPFLHKQAPVVDPSQIVVHRSDQHLIGLYTTHDYRHDGQRGSHTRLGGDDCEAQAQVACDVREPASAALSATVEFRRVPVAPAPEPRAAATATPERVQSDMRSQRDEPGSPPITFFPRNAVDDYLDAYCAAAGRYDFAACSTLTQQYAQTPQAQAMQQQGRELYEAELQRQMEEQARQERERQALQAQRQMEMEMEQQQAHRRGRGR